MTAGRPILYFGPRPSHITDLLDAHDIGIPIEHGNVSGAVSAIRDLMQTPREKLKEMGDRAQAILRQNLSQRMLCGTFCDRLEAAMFARENK